MPVPAYGTSQANPRLPRQPCQIVAATNTTDTTYALLLIHTLNGFHPEPYRRILLSEKHAYCRALVSDPGSLVEQ